MRDLAVITTDSTGDSFCKKYNTYLRANLPTTQDHLQQLEKNYESVYGELPEADEMKKQLEFMQLFFAELGEMYHKTPEAKCAMKLAWLVVDGCPVTTAQRLTDIGLK